MTLFIFFDSWEHAIAMLHSAEEANRFERHTRQQEPDKCFLRLEIAGTTLVSSAVIEPEKT